MNIDLEPGIYVVAVSGGVDSMTLLDLVRKQPGVKIVVAHFDHGIREDSNLDRELVQEIAELHGLPFVFHEGHLGSDTDEEEARQARYDFLHKVREAAGAKAIITAHHQDDLLETAVHNLLRGTGRKGLDSLKNTKLVKRPLLHLSKAELQKYAETNKLRWREDPTNQDIKYTRNYIRHKILPKLTLEQKRTLLNHISRASQSNQRLDLEIANFLQSHGDEKILNRQEFIKLSHKVSLEIMASWLRSNGIRQFDRKLLEKLVADAKTLKPGKQSDINRQYSMTITKDSLALVSMER